MKSRKHIALTAVFAFSAFAEEGMWTLNGFPKDAVNKKYGSKITDAWLKHVQLSSARLTGTSGCSGSFVSEGGLVISNHHCAEACIQDISTAQRDYMRAGFYAAKQADEPKCPGLEVNQLIDIHDVTAEVQTATRGLDGQKYIEAQNAAIARLEKACAENDAYRCDVVNLYHGGFYHVYKYRKYRDVRLVFAPEFEAAFFGGDPENFMFPRYDLDVSFVRVYENGAPARTPDHFSWSKGGPKDGELVFTSGNPGATSRLDTISELEFDRDLAFPFTLINGSELRGTYAQFRRIGPEQKREVQKDFFGLENSLKAFKGREAALLDRAFFAKKVEAEKAFRAKVAADPAKQKLYGAAWDEIAKATEKFKTFYKPYVMIEAGRGGSGGFRGRLFQFAKLLIRAAEERTKDDAKRLKEFRDSNLPQLKHGVLSPAPIFADLEELQLTFGFTKLREILGSEDPTVRKVLGAKSPEELAHEVVTGTKLADVALRTKLWDGGKKAIDASDDPMINLVKLVDGDARALRKKYEDEVEAVRSKNSELIAKALFEVYGTSIYPDATFTLRISVGQVKGYEENGRQIAPFTTLAGAFDHATGREPYALPESWKAAKARLKLDTPFDFASTNDIIGGNSGSPVIDQDAEIVGLIFDGNIQSLGADFGFDESIYRAVSVDSAALEEALKTIYGADRIVAEIRAKPAASTF